MKTDFNIQVHVDFGVTPELAALAASVIGHRRMPEGEAQASERPADADQGAVSEGEAQPKAEAPAQEAGTAKPEQPAEAEGPRKLKEQDIRDAIHLTRQRIEGENYKDETGSESYQKYHRQLTAWFKNTAALLGADKPSALIATAGQDAARAFIAECDRLQIMEDGTIGIPKAF